MLVLEKLNLFFIKSAILKEVIFFCRMAVTANNSIVEV